MLNKFRHMNVNIIGIKSLLYRLISFIIQTVLLILLLPLSFGAVSISIILMIQKTIVYFGFDYIFLKQYRVSKDEGFVLWATGVSGVGKSTILDALAKRLEKKGRRIERLDGDIVRESLCSDLGFSESDRNENIKRVTFVSKLLSRNGAGVLASFISPYEEVRQNINKEVTNFIDLSLVAPREVLIERDPKGLYKKAINGEIKGLTGYDGEYEEPIKPKIRIDTNQVTVEEAVDIVYDYLKSRKLI